jgi:hypothetical protein
MNESLKGWVNYYKHYHVYDIYQKMNDVLEKQKNNRKELSNVKPIDLSQIKPFVSKEKWQNLFT